MRMRLPAERRITKKDVKALNALQDEFCKNEFFAAEFKVIGKLIEIAERHDMMPYEPIARPWYRRRVAAKRRARRK